MPSLILSILLPAIFALLGTLWVHPKVLKIAIMKNIVDNPDARKLQRNPVPAMGGVAVFFGIVIGICSSQMMLSNHNVFVLLAAMLIMLYIGTIDDILDLSPTTRFIIEILVVSWIMYTNSISINSLEGIWGLNELSAWVSYPLTIFASVGIINAINLIDGVNGLSSGFCFIASVLFATMFYSVGDHAMAIIASSAAGAIIPFFFHNVFGYKSRMFIGDGGTLLMGIMMSAFVISIIDKQSSCTIHSNTGMSMTAFVLAVLAIPVFDTIRVMFSRILRGTSPFHPDRTHLHHLFINLGFSHAGTTISILTMNSIIVMSWFATYKAGAPKDMQLYTVIALGGLVTFIFYKYATTKIKKQGKTLAFFSRIAKTMHLEKKGFWLHLQNFIDKI